MGGMTLQEASEEFLYTKLEPFTAQDFQAHLKKHKYKISLDEIYGFLATCDVVFALVNNMFLTYAGAFTGRWFCFKPSKEEVEKEVFFGGHRFMPFMNPAYQGFAANLYFGETPILHVPGTISMNQALDIYALYGEGYSIPVILEDPSCEPFSFSSVQYGLPHEVRLTGFDLKPYLEAGFEYGDRILCRVLDWKNNIIQTKIRKEKHSSLKISFADMEYEEWYSTFEECMLQKFDRHGPCNSIQQQLALLILEEQGKLCNENCGSIDEFMQHTTQLGFSQYGIESRIWRYNESIPFVGEWNKQYADQAPFPCLALLSADYVITSFIKEMINRKEKLDSAEELYKKIYPESLSFTDFESEFIMLHLEKRIDIVKKEYNRFTDFPLVAGRHQVLILFRKIMNLIARITDSHVPLIDLPQQDLIMANQVAEHVAAFLEEFEVAPEQAENEMEDMMTSLSGMIDSFDAIEDSLLAAIKKTKKNR